MLRTRPQSGLMMPGCHWFRVATVAVSVPVMEVGNGGVFEHAVLVAV
jgi:hypothetical protein